jgi:hypothetical protein
MRIVAEIIGAVVMLGIFYYGVDKLTDWITQQRKPDTKKDTQNGN